MTSLERKWPPYKIGTYSLPCFDQEKITAFLHGKIKEINRNKGTFWSEKKEEKIWLMLQKMILYVNVKGMA